MTITTSRKLELDDIADVRAYEREREGFRAEIIALKKRRRVGVGPFVTMLFENRATIRFQIQEMARVEKLLSDEAIEGELRTYNPLIPEPGELALTLFVELTTDDDLRAWLPRLVGIERSVGLEVGVAGNTEFIAALPDEEHAEHLTREDITASVHYLHFRLTPAQIEAFASDPVTLRVRHAAYDHCTELHADTVKELLADLRA